jgi:hypothetical protein
MIDERWCAGGSREERSVPVVVDSDRGGAGLMVRPRG